VKSRYAKNVLQTTLQNNLLNLKIILYQFLY